MFWGSHSSFRLGIGFYKRRNVSYTGANWRMRRELGEQVRAGYYRALLHRGWLSVIAI